MASPRRELGRLAGNSAIYTVAAVFSRGAAFLLLPVYTRYLGAEGYGIVAVAAVVTSVLGVLLPLSLHAAVARLYHDEADPDARARAVGSVWMAVVLVALVVTLVLDAAGPTLLGRVIRSVPFDPYLRLALWTACFTAIGLVPLQFLQTLQRARDYVLLSAGGLLFTTVLVLYFVAVRQDGAEGYLRGLMLGAAVTAVGGALMVRSELRPALRRDVLVAALAFSLPLIPHTVGGWVLELSDRAILERFVSIGEVGVYSVGYQVGMLMSILATSVNGALAPHLYAADATHGREAMGRDVARIATYYCLVLGAAAAVLTVVAVDVVRLLASPAFAAADAVARPVVLGQLAGGLYYIPANVLFIRARTGVLPLVTGAAALLNVGLNLALVPRHGIVAAAWTTTAAFVVMLVLTVFVAARVQRVPFETRRLVVIAVAIAITVACGWTAAGLEGPTGVIVRLLCLALFPITLVVGGFATREERATLSGSARRLVRRARGSSLTMGGRP